MLNIISVLYHKPNLENHMKYVYYDNIRTSCKNLYESIQ